MIDYDITVMFLSPRERETILVRATNPVRAIQTALYQMERWDRTKQDDVLGLMINPARRQVIDIISPIPRRPLLRRPAA